MSVFIITEYKTNIPHDVHVYDTFPVTLESDMVRSGKTHHIKFTKKLR